MIHLDISKALHPRTFGYFAPLMPGLFFEISILLSGSHTLLDLGGRAQLGYYTSLVVALILAFIIGNGFMLLVRLIQFAMSFCYRVASFVLNEIAYALVKPIERLMSWPRLPYRMRIQIVKLRQSLIERTFPSALAEVQRAWHQAATVLLKDRYGIEPHRRGMTTEWGIWYNILGTPTPEQLRGYLLVIASEATGWSGIVAAQISPALKSRYYLSFSILLVLYGVIADWFVVGRLNNPIASGALRVHAVLAEIKEARIDNLKLRGDPTREDKDDLS